MKPIINVICPRWYLFHLSTPGGHVKELFHLATKAMLRLRMDYDVAGDIVTPPDMVKYNAVGMPPGRSDA